MFKSIVLGIVVVLGFVNVAQAGISDWTRSNVLLRFTAGSALVDEYNLAEDAYKGNPTPDNAARVSIAAGAVLCSHSLSGTPSTPAEIAACKIVGAGSLWWSRQLQSLTTSNDIPTFVADEMVGKVGKFAGNASNLVRKVQIILRAMPDLSEEEIGAIILAEAAAHSDVFIATDKAYADNLSKSLIEYFGKNFCAKWFSEEFDKKKMVKVYLNWYAKNCTM